MNWLDALLELGPDVPAVLVTVAAAQGSVPREAGAKMLVCAQREFDTIGGGHLEWQAARAARAMLEEGGTAPRRRLERFALGPTLGQCCGGVVWLAFERLAARDHAHFRDLDRYRKQQRETWRLIPLDSNDEALLANSPTHLLPGLEARDANDACHLQQDAQQKQWLADPCRPPRAHLYLFGAGHVGAALVRALAELPCRVTWIDEREERFAAQLPANVQIECTDVPQAVIAHAEPGASFLVMTHSHALDQQLAEAVLRRADFAWFGLIGSRTKRLQFERRMRAHGISEAALARMTCPIGLPGIEGKEPAVIAIAVCAQLLQAWEAAAARPAGKEQPLPTLSRHRS